MAMAGFPVVLGAKQGQQPEVAAFAVAEAARRRTGLRVVHACDDAAVSLSVFDDLTQVVAGHGHGVDVHFLVVGGDPVEALLQEAHRAAAIVVGADHGPWVARLLGAEISQTVATLADAPVIVVPPVLPGTRSRRGIVAALDVGGEVDAELAFAFQSADRQHEPLRVVHVAGATSDYPRRRNRWYRIEDTIDQWRARYPGVDVQTVVEPGHPVDTCVLASAHASLLVVGQPASEHPRLASRAVVARLLRRSNAPVAVVPVGHDRTRTSA